MPPLDGQFSDCAPSPKNPSAPSDGEDDVGARIRALLGNEFDAGGAPHTGYWQLLAAVGSNQFCI